MTTALAIRPNHGNTHGACPWLDLTYGIPANVIGAAIERSGKIVDALQYYENLLEDVGEGQTTRRFAAERLVYNLERHSRYLERRESRLQAQQQRTRRISFAGAGASRIEIWTIIPSSENR